MFRQALSDARRMRLALSLRLVLLPAPAEELRLAVERFGPPDGEQGTLFQSARMARLACLREAVSQVRTVAGPEAALRALCMPGTVRRTSCPSHSNRDPPALSSA